MTRRRTYWHLSDIGRRPTEYDVATSRLHYWAGRGFEVKVPLDEWYARHQRGSPLSCTDWERFSDPRATTYTTYTAIQHARETFVEGLLESLDDDYDRRLSPPWLAVLDRVLAPLRYPVHGLQMAAAYVGHLAPASRITIAAAFQAADEVRRTQRLAYRMRQLQETYPAFGHDARARWQDDPPWQPLREALERLLVTWDWGEALVALQLVVKPAFDELFMTQLGRLARASGDDVLERMLFSLDADCRWHRQWSAALVSAAVRDTPGNASHVETWIARWTPRAIPALAAFRPVFENLELPASVPSFEAVIEDVERARREQCASALGLSGPGTGAGASPRRP
jgi:toluene monooxygenase system protein E